MTRDQIPEETMKRPLLTVAEVAERLGMTRAGVYQAIARKQIPYVELWRGERRACIRFDQDTLDAFIEERSRGVEGAGVGQGNPEPELHRLRREVNKIIGSDDPPKPRKP